MTNKRCVRLAALMVAAMCCASGVCATSGRSLGPLVAEDNPELLGVVLEANTNHATVVYSGQGVVTVDKTVQFEDGSVMETEAKYDLAFSGDTIMLSKELRYLKNEIGRPLREGEVPYAVGTVRQTKVWSDGMRATSYDQARSSAVTGAMDCKAGGDLNSASFEIVVSPYARCDAGLCDLNKLHDSLCIPTYRKDEPRMIGRQTVDGDECIVVEFVYTTDLPGGKEYRHTWNFWVDPSKGYTVLRARKWSEGGPFKARTLVGELDVFLSYCGDAIWVPNKITQCSYAYDESSDSTQVREKLDIELSSDFRFNEPVADAALELVLPSGTKLRDDALDIETVIE